MKKRLIALLLVAVLLIPAGLASAAGWYRVNTSSLKVHYLAAENSKVLGSYRRDYAATVNSKSGDWSYVTFSNGVKGWVMSKYLSKGSTGSAWIYADNTNLRKGPDGGFAATAYLARGTKVSVLAWGTKYSYVSAGSFGKGYVVNSLLSKTKIKNSGNGSKSTKVSGGNYTAWVSAAPGQKINLRKSASTKAAVIKTYGAGTQVHVISHGAEWDKITIGSYTGYMMTKFLVTSQPAETATPKPNNSGSSSYTAYITTPNKKYVNVRKGPSTGYSTQFTVNYGVAVKVLQHGTTWDYIQYNGKKGYVKNEFLQIAKPSGTAVVDATPTPFVKFNGKITSPNGKSVNFHKGKGDGYSNVHGVGQLKVGTAVKVLKIEGGWAKIQYGKYVGWIHKEFVKKTE